jgi:golgi-specific brefeldin A-resistance guanine nucleotide exchange factor 1
LLEAKSQKQLILTGASRFNSKPKSGVAFLEENGLLQSSPDVSKTQSLARFLKTCTRLDKRLLGDYVSKPDNLDLLEVFMGLFDFKDVRLLLSIGHNSMILMDNDVDVSETDS